MRKVYALIIPVCAALLLSACSRDEWEKMLETSGHEKTADLQKPAQTAARPTVTPSAPVKTASEKNYPAGTDDDFRDTKGADRYSYFPPYHAGVSYDAVKKDLADNKITRPENVRTEDFINAFTYNYPAPYASGSPAAITTEYTECPWNKAHRLVKIGVRAKDAAANTPDNYVFLIDVSGSMGKENKLPLVKKSFPFLVNQLGDQDTVSIVTYAKTVETPLEGVKGSQKDKINDAITALKSGGRTNGSAGLTQAYTVAKKYFLKDGNNRIILATDGYFNIGPTSIVDLEDQIEKEKDGGVYLTVLGYGMGDFKEPRMQTMAEKGKGAYVYVNDIREAEKIWAQDFNAAPAPAAKDVKFKVEFNPVKVASYRLIGYKRIPASDPDKDLSFDLPQGGQFTALYEVVPRCESCEDEDPKYDVYEADGPRCRREVMDVKMYYKSPGSEIVQTMDAALPVNKKVAFDQASEDTRFAAAAAQFGQILEDNKAAGTMPLDAVIAAAQGAQGTDAKRAEFISAAQKYKQLTAPPPPPAKPAQPASTPAKK